MGVFYADKIRQRKKRGRVAVLRDAALEPCLGAGSCEAGWDDVLRKNGVAPDVFTAAVYALSSRGREKGLCIMLCGGANCRKTGLLEPLHFLFNV